MIKYFYRDMPRREDKLDVWCEETETDYILTVKILDVIDDHYPIGSTYTERISKNVFKDYPYYTAYLLDKVKGYKISLNPEYCCRNTADAAGYYRRDGIRIGKLMYVDGTLYIYQKFKYHPTENAASIPVGVGSMKTYADMEQYIPNYDQLLNNYMLKDDVIASKVSMLDSLAMLEAQVDILTKLCMKYLPEDTLKEMLSEFDKESVFNIKSQDNIVAEAKHKARMRQIQEEYYSKK